MKEILTYYISKLQRYNKSLEKKNLFIEKSWITPMNDLEIAKIIFLDDGRVLISRKTGVTEGSWEYIQGSESIYLKFESIKLLLKAKIINQYLLAFEGSLDEESLVLINEKIVDRFSLGLNNNESLQLLFETLQLAIEKDTNLFNLEESKLKIEENFFLEREINNGLKIYLNKDCVYSQITGFRPLIINSKGEVVKDYTNNIYIKFPRRFMGLNNGKVEINSKFSETDSDKGLLKILHLNKANGLLISKKDIVLLGDEPAPNGVYKLGWFNKITIEDGKIK